MKIISSTKSDLSKDLKFFVPESNNLCKGLASNIWLFCVSSNDSNEIIYLKINYFSFVLNEIPSIFKISSIPSSQKFFKNLITENLNWGAITSVWLFSFSFSFSCIVCDVIKRGLKKPKNLKFHYLSKLFYLNDDKNWDSNGTYSNSSDALIFLKGNAAHSQICLSDWFISWTPSFKSLIA